MSEKADVVIIGGGPGGTPAAMQLASRGKRVLLVEKSGKLGEEHVCSSAVSLQKSSSMPRTNMTPSGTDRQAIGHFQTMPAFSGMRFAPGWTAFCPCAQQARCND